MKYLFDNVILFVMNEKKCPCEKECQCTQCQCDNCEPLDENELLDEYPILKRILNEIKTNH